MKVKWKAQVKPIRRNRIHDQLKLTWPKKMALGWTAARSTKRPAMPNPRMVRQE